MQCITHGSKKQSSRGRCVASVRDRGIRKGRNSGGDDYAAGLRHHPGNRDIGARERGDDLALPQARGVVFESDLVIGFIVTKAAQSVNIGKFAQLLQLIAVQGGLQLEGDFHESHRW